MGKSPSIITLHKISIGDFNNDYLVFSLFFKIVIWYWLVSYLFFVFFFRYLKCTNTFAHLYKDPCLAALSALTLPQSLWLVELAEAILAFFLLSFSFSPASTTSLASLRQPGQYLQQQDMQSEGGSFKNVTQYHKKVKSGWLCVYFSIKKSNISCSNLSSWTTEHHKIPLSSLTHSW